MLEVDITLLLVTQIKFLEISIVSEETPIKLMEIKILLWEMTILLLEDKTLFLDKTIKFLIHKAIPKKTAIISIHLLTKLKKLLKE